MKYFAIIACLASLLALAGQQAACQPQHDCAQAAAITAHALQLPNDQAIGEFAKASDLCPGMDEPKYDQAIFLTRANRYPEALTVIGRIDGERQDVALLKARILIQLGREQEAEPILKKLLDENTHLQEASLLLSALNVKLEKLPDALKVLLDIPKPEYDNPYVQINLGLLYEKIGKLEDANATMEGIAQNAALSDEMRIELAQFFIRNNNNAEAALVLRPVADPGMKLLFAKVLLATKQYDESERVVRSLPTSPDQQELLAVLLIVRHQEEQALTTLQNMEKRSGKLSPKLTALKGFVYLSLGMTERAREAASAALTDDATAALAHYVLGEALSRLGSKTAGSEEKQKAIALDKRFAEPASEWWNGWF